MLVRPGIAPGAYRSEVCYPLSDLTSKQSMRWCKCIIWVPEVIRLAKVHDTTAPTKYAPPPVVDIAVNLNRRQGAKPVATVKRVTSHWTKITAIINNAKHQKAEMLVGS